jgi:hypothetical protein
MPAQIATDSVIISKSSFDSDDPYDIIWSNISFLNVLFKEHLRHDEVSVDALRSYHVDYYLADVRNGGFSQFVYNSRWAKDAVRRVREGLRAVGAAKHLALFGTGAALVKQLGKKGLRTYLDGEYFDDNPVRDDLNAVNDEFFGISKRENLIALNSAWLRRSPNLVVMTIPQMKKEVERRVRSIPDRGERIAVARANEPRFEKLIRALCECAGHELKHVTVGDPSHVYAGRQNLAWHFITDQGPHHMVEVDGKALMFRGHSKKPVCEMDAPDE